MADQKRLNLSLRAGESLIKDLKTTLSIPPNVLLQLGKLLNTTKGIKLKDEDQVLKIWCESQLPAENLQDAFSVLKHLFDSAIEEKVDIETLLSEISELCKLRNIPGFEERKDAIRAFLTPNKQYLLKQEFSSWLYGVLPNLDSTSGTVQLRAAFESRDSTDSKGYLPICQIRLVCDYDYEGSRKKHFVFQTDEKGLDELIKSLQSFKKQLQKMKKDLTEKVNVIDLGDKE